MEVNIYHYTQEERWHSFQDVVMCLCTMHATLSGGFLAESNEEMLDGSEDAAARSSRMLPSEAMY